MYKFLFENLLIIIVGLLIISQLILPSFVPGLEYWWLFKRTKKEPEKPPVVVDKENLRAKVDHTVEMVKEVKSEVNENLKDAHDLKDKLTNEDN